MASTSGRGISLASLGLVVAGLAGCSLPADTACVPELSVTPDEPRPGRIVTVATARACADALPEGERWEIRIQPADKAIQVARAFVQPEPDGSFTLRITVPPTIGPWPAGAPIAKYREFDPCPSTPTCLPARVPLPGPPSAN